MNGWILMDGVIDIWMERRIDVFDDSVKLNSPTRLRDNMKLPNERTECELLRPELELVLDWDSDSVSGRSEPTCFLYEGTTVTVTVRTSS